ncbi:uracil-DNA glycosylase [Bacillus salacetis]|uniref:Uracil-DNA glycosylase n=1 Tax=Bacillus salacetis TaxID=2315464 RepID=A0A3A1QTK8_9BACI|nr:uracil-DNA glycosylase [Bacillus salacetis]RIW29124.1 uracil-DNA glycosylase [Bacillus salacetis]
MAGILRNDWNHVLENETEKTYFHELQEFLENEYRTEEVFPEKQNIFNALNSTPYNEVKVVLLGQDPYHGRGQAQGLSFSVGKDVRIPPSLKNIYRELHDDIGCGIPDHGNLSKWSEQGVLLLNTVLTVREGQAHSHKGQGWETFTDKVIELLNNRENPLVFMLWGRPAQEKLKLIDSSRHFVIQSPHPSPFSARKGFFGSKPFSRANEWLKENGGEEIDWCIE